MQQKNTHSFKSLYRSAIYYAPKALALFLGATILGFAGYAIFRSFLDINALRLYELSTSSANEVHLSIDSFDADTGTVQVTAKPEYADLFIVSDLQRVIPEFANPQIADHVPHDVRFGKLLVSDLSSYLQAGGLQLAQIDLYPEPPDCSSKRTIASGDPEADKWKVLPRPFDRNFDSLLKGPEMYPFDEYLVIGGANRAIEFCYKGKSYKRDSTLDVAVSLPGYSVTSATANELLTWPTLENPEPDINGMPQGKKVKQLQFHLPKYDQQLWQDKQIALMIRRPLALRMMTILLFGITTVATIFLAFTSTSLS